MEVRVLSASSSSGGHYARTSARHVKKPSAERFFLFFPIAVFYLECVFRLGAYGSLMNFYTLMFSIAGGVLFVLLSTIFNRRVNRIVADCLLGGLGVLYSLHYVYYKFFAQYFLWSTIGMAGKLTEFYREIFAAIFKSFGMILLFFLPFAFYMVFGEKLLPALRSNWRARCVYGALMLVAHLLAIIVIALHGGEFNDNYYYRGALDGTSAPEYMTRFGVLITTRKDFRQILFGVPEEKVEKPTGDVTDLTGKKEDEQSPTEEPKAYVDQVMDIDFDALIANEKNATIKDMHEYFASVTPTKTNAYTGMFEGKNLIYLTLEGFSYKVIDPNLTPVLYKMATQGFVFENFYNSVWGGSTATGEYAGVTGNFYNSANCLKMSGSTFQPFALGRQFSKIGYTTIAYHNHTYDYYGRDKSHPNLGYTYKAIGNGLTLATNSWPRSDLEMAQATAKEYINSDKPFHIYYMTVSGHANYNWMGNNMCKKHRDEVQHLPYSENVKAYIACQLEVEYMLADLIDELDKAGKLQDTVFAMNADHYPYALEDSELAELYGLPESGIRANFDLYRNGFLLWSASMDKPVKVTKPCSAIDIIPTLSNLFGLTYDSRLIAGTDIMATNVDPVVILNCSEGGSWHWITPYGQYNTKKKTFTPAEGVDWDTEKQNEYVRQINKIVAAKRNYSFKVLDKDYYRYVFG